MADAPLKVLFFASLRDDVGVAELTLSAPVPENLAQLGPRLQAQLGPLAVEALQTENVRIAVNQDLTLRPLRFCSGDEIAFMPPVTGG